MTAKPIPQPLRENPNPFFRDKCRLRSYPFIYLLIYLCIYILRNVQDVTNFHKVMCETIGAPQFKRYNTDKMYRIAVDSAKRALLQASPLKFPKEKIRNLKNFLIVFDPRDAI